MLDLVVGWGAKQQADKISGQGSIFDLGDEAERPRHHPTLPSDEWDKRRSSCSRRRASACTCPSTRSTG